jgi:hypothetical protein
MKTLGLIAIGLFVGYWMPMFFSLGAVILRHCS